MQRTLELAAKARGNTRTNPMVGAVIVKDGRVIGEGFHRCFGGEHAEVDAIRNATEPVAGANMYVNLEPCSHFGKTPPCAQALNDAKIKRVYAAMVDPNPQVSGKGIAILREAGVEVIVGVCEHEARRLNEAYIKYITTGMPFVTLKIAQTLDGKISDYQGNAKWITSEESRHQVHVLRSQMDAALIGHTTANVDDPSLTTHGIGDKNPLRIVLSSGGDLGAQSQLVKGNSDRKTVVVKPVSAGQNRESSDDISGVAVREMPADGEGQVALVELLRHLGRQEVVSLLVEGGSRVFSAFLDQGLADKVIFVIAPKLLGDGIVGFLSDKRELSRALTYRIGRTYQLGGDIWIETYPEQRCLQG